MARKPIRTAKSKRNARASSRKPPTNPRAPTEVMPGSQVVGYPPYAWIIQCQPRLAEGEDLIDEFAAATGTLLAAFAHVLQSRPQDEGHRWLGLVAVNRVEWQGWTTWIGVAPDVPDEVAKVVRFILERRGIECRMESGDPQSEGVRPRIWIEDNQVVVLVDPSMGISPTEVLFYRQAAGGLPVQFQYLAEE